MLASLLECAGGGVISVLTTEKGEGADSRKLRWSLYEEKSPADSSLLIPLCIFDWVFITRSWQYLSTSVGKRQVSSLLP